MNSSWSVEISESGSGMNRAPASELIDDAVRDSGLGLLSAKESVFENMLLTRFGLILVDLFLFRLKNLPSRCLLMIEPPKDYVRVSKELRPALFTKSNIAVHRKGLCFRLVSDVTEIKMNLHLLENAASCCLSGRRRGSFERFYRDLSLAEKCNTVCSRFCS